MTSKEKTLWDKIRQFQLDAPKATFSFSDRLCRENGWNYAFTIRAIQEYKRFMFLICIAPHALTPSDEVDQVWHLHLTYTRSYWIDFCQQTIGQDIHHEPTQGGTSERSKFNDWYARTKAFYTEKFGQAPPIDLWPSSEKRFGELRFQRVNLHRNWIVPKIFIK